MAKDLFLEGRANLRLFLMINKEKCHLKEGER